jgi:ADP-heptose:LPS heptosyltransferase
LQVPGIFFISLQKEYPDSNLPALARLPIERINEATDGFDNTAALMEHCDLIISTDTSIPHLAGALGRPVWLLLSYSAEWRWLVDRTDSPWYPTMRLFRQRRLGDWESVATDVIAALAGEFPPRAASGIMPA